MSYIKMSMDGHGICQAYIESQDTALNTAKDKIRELEKLILGSEVLQAQSQEDTLYILTVSGDLAKYYDRQQGAGAWAALTADDQAKIVRYVHRIFGGAIADSGIAGIA